MGEPRGAMAEVRAEAEAVVVVVGVMAAVMVGGVTDLAAI